MRLGAVSYGRGNGLTGEHMGPVELSINHTVQKHLPVGLRFQSDKEPLILKVALFIGHRQRCHIGQLDEAQGQLVFLDVQHLCPHRGCCQTKGRCQSNYQSHVNLQSKNKKSRTI